MLSAGQSFSETHAPGARADLSGAKVPAKPKLWPPRKQLDVGHPISETHFRSAYVNTLGGGQGTRGAHEQSALPNTRSAGQVAHARQRGRASTLCAVQTRVEAQSPDDGTNTCAGHPERETQEGTVRATSYRGHQRDETHPFFAPASSRDLPSMLRNPEPHRRLP